MATSWKSQQGNGEYRLQFETDNEEEYKLVEKAAQMAMDGKTEADFEEVKHGYWKHNLYCSVCGYLYDTGEYTNAKDFCPNCGAKMDGGNAE